MRTLAALAALPLLMTSIATAVAAADDPLQPLAGRWRCATADGRVADRAYFLHDIAFGPRTGAKELYGRTELTDGYGIPRTSVERISENGAGASVEAPEGTGSSSSLAFPLRFAGQGQSAAFTLTYTVDRNGMQRTATQGAATVDDERCVKQSDPAANATCTTNSALPSVVHQTVPTYPKDALNAKASGAVHLRVIMDDQSRVVWTDVLDSASPLLTASAVQAARDSTYRTMVVNCTPMPAEEYFTVKFG